MLQDFHLKIVHCVEAKHSNMEVLNINLVGRYEVDEEFGNEIQNLGGTNQKIPKPQIAKEAKIVINLFIVIKVDARNYSKEVEEKGKELVLYQNEE